MIEAIGIEIRKQIKREMEKRSGSPVNGDMQGMCLACSITLFMALKLLKQKVTFHYGLFGTLTKEYHSWVSFNNQFIDLTRTQFKPLASLVHFVNARERDEYTTLETWHNMQALCKTLAVNEQIPPYHVMKQIAKEIVSHETH